MKKCLVFGASGVIGSEVVTRFESHGYEVWRASRSAKGGSAQNLVAVGDSEIDSHAMKSWPEFDAVVWAQGSNVNDSIVNFSSQVFDEVLNANIKFVASTLASLLNNGKILAGSRLCIVSSIWQDAVRPNKLSYSVSKAALNGLLKSVALDLSEKKIFVNAILPGVLDTPMTRSVLSDDQIKSVQSRTGFNRLVLPNDLSAVIYFLCSDSNACVTGQSVVADLGFSNVRAL